MRSFATWLIAFAVIGLGYWAYDQNVQTKEALREVSRLHAEIGAARERRAMLRDEWAYLTRPDRLRELVELNATRLGLLQMTPEQFAHASQIAYPAPEDEFIASDDAELLQGSASGPEVTR
ncbi:cell division protein FtsL [Rhodobacterales bacterium HKCCE3408]|nr:cell division protein FtsL [Rhodobacterales bacterium HKCCE3408]